MYTSNIIHLMQKIDRSCASNISGTLIPQNEADMSYNEFKRKQIVWGRTKEKSSPLPLP